ncbi:MAG: hypothetical protein JNK74_17485 [Candidatus Hydrogenedentes bacterium]|nr:hypothetical protein [Candidatus Hydrogenedentota bacterium]
MHTITIPRVALIVSFLVLAAGAAVTPAVAKDMSAGDRIVVAQASETSTPPEAPAMDHGRDAAADAPAIPDPNPKLNKKRAAFWGVTFMLATSLAFAVFGVWAIKKTPKSGQQRPE